MHDGTYILSIAAFSSNMRRAGHSAFEGVHSVYWRQLLLKLRYSAVAGLMICFSDFSLWFSLPLTIWLGTGWVGLIFHWQTIARTACQMEAGPGE